MQTAIQLYTLRHLEEPLPDTITRVGETDFDGVEFAGLGDATGGDVTTALADARLDVAAAHVPIEALEDDLDETVETYRDVGCYHLVVPWLPPEAFVSREAVEETARRLAALGDRVRDHDCAFSYHNHNQEFQPVDGTSAFDVLVEETDALTFELDAGWALAAGHDPVDLIRDLDGRIPIVHFKDVAVGANLPDGEGVGYAVDDHDTVELGEGDLDVEAVAAAAADADVEWACYEHDTPDDPLQSLQYGSDRLSRLV